MARVVALLAGVAGLCVVGAGARAAEHYIGGPVNENGLEIVGNYLTDIKMEPMPPGAATQGNPVHLELDVHANADEAHGFPEGAWMPYLPIVYTLTKKGSDFVSTGRLMAMTAKDGPHYANNVAFAGDGNYHVVYTISPPSVTGFVRHVDQASGVPAWWAPFTVAFDFDYPAGK